MDGWNTTFLLGRGLFSGAFWLVLGSVRAQGKGLVVAILAWPNQRLMGA